MMPSPSSDRVYLRIRNCDGNGDGDDHSSTDDGPLLAAVGPRAASYSGPSPTRRFKLPLEAKFEMLLSALDADDSRGSSTTSSGGHGRGGDGLLSPNQRRRRLVWGDRPLHEWETPAGVGMKPGASHETELRVERAAAAAAAVVLCDASLPVRHAASASVVHVPVRIEVCAATQIPHRVRVIPPPGFRITLDGPCDHEGFVPSLDRSDSVAKTPKTAVEAAAATSAYLRALQETFTSRFPFEELPPSAADANDADSTLRFDTAIDVRPDGGGAAAVRIAVELVVCKATQRPLCVRVVPPAGYRVALDGPCDVEGYVEQLDRRRPPVPPTKHNTVVDYLRELKAILTRQFPFVHEKVLDGEDHYPTVDVTLPLHRQSDGAAMSIAAELELCPTYNVPLRVRVRPPPGYRIGPSGPCDADGYVPALDRTTASAAALAVVISTAAAGTPEDAATSYVRELSALLGAAYPFETITQATQRQWGADGSPRASSVSGAGGVPGSPDGRGSDSGGSIEQTWSPANDMTPKD